MRSWLLHGVVVQDGLELKVYQKGTCGGAVERLVKGQTRQQRWVAKRKAEALTLVQAVGACFGEAMHAEEVPARRAVKSARTARRRSGASSESAGILC